MDMPGKISESRIQTVCLVFLSAVAATYLIYWLRPVLVPLVVAFFVVSGVSPILAMLERRLGVKRLVAAGLTFLAGVMILVVFGFSIWLSVLEVSKNADDYRKRVRVLVLEMGDLVPTAFAPHDRQPARSRLKDWDSRETATEPDDLSAEPDDLSADADDSSADADDQAKLDRASELVDSILRDGIASLSQALIGLVSTSVVVLIYVFFLLIGTPSVAKSPAAGEIDIQVRRICHSRR